MSHSTEAFQLRLTDEQQEQYFLTTGAWPNEVLALDRRALHALLLFSRSGPAAKAGTELTLTPAQRKELLPLAGYEPLTLMLPQPDASNFVSRERWEGTLEPLLVGECFLILPEGAPQPPHPERRIIALDVESGRAGSVCGSGRHLPTQLLLTLLESWVKPGERVLDFGTGSGILAVGAALLGAGEVLAVDHHPGAVSAAERNVAINRVQSVVEIRQGSTDVAAGEFFDLVVANLPSGLLVPLAPELGRLVRPGGVLIVGGFRSARAPMVLEAATSEPLALLETREREGWLGLVFRRSSG